MASLMSHTRAVRREDLAREAEAEGGGNPSSHGRVDDKAEDGEAVVARAALDAYMKSTLGLQFDILQPQSQLQPAPAPAKSTSKSKTEPEPSQRPDRGEDNGDDSDQSMSSSDDNETKQRPSSGIQQQRKKKASTATGFAFRLFSGSGKATNPAQKADTTSAQKTASDAAPAQAPIVLLDDGDGTEAPGEGGLLNPPRPLSFYLAGEPSAKALSRYAQVAVSGEDVINASHSTRAWGWEVPWRARTVIQAPSKTAMRALLANALASDAAEALPENLALALSSAANALPSWASSSQSPEPATPLPLLRQPVDPPATKHRRPGKRRRIILRKREQARLEKVAKAAAQAQSKEEHLSEKKKRLNRIKKLRRREKKRVAKGAEGGDGDDDGDVSGDGSGGD